MSSIVFISSLLIHPRPARRHLSLRAFAYPTALALTPQAVLVNHPIPRLVATTRAFEILTLNWLFLGVALAFYRTVIRLFHALKKDNLQSRNPDLHPDNTIRLNPLWSALMCHSLAWRVATLPFGEIPGSWRWPWDVTTVVGTAGGIMCFWGEIRRLIKLYDSHKGETC